MGKNEDGSDITQDVDVLVWWRDVGQARFLRFKVTDRQFLSISTVNSTLHFVNKIPFQQVLPYLLTFITVDWTNSKFHSTCVRVSELLSVLSFLIRQ
jgi:hypothetical protein